MSVNPIVTTDAPMSHQLTFLSISLEKMDPVLDLMLIAQNISPRFTVKNAIAIAFTQWVPLNTPAKDPNSR